MGYRLSRIYTRTGDDGSSAAADGSRMAKDDTLMQAQGELDELNSVLGLLACCLRDTDLDELRLIQHRLFDIGGEISLGQAMLPAAEVTWLEQCIDRINARLAPLQEFILPGGNEAGARCHLARAVCRRAERAMVTLARERSVNPASLAFVNRLSDYLFVLARSLNDGEEIYWQSQRLQHAHRD